MHITIPLSLSFQCFEVAQKMNNELLESVKEMTLVGLALCVVNKLRFIASWEGYQLLF